MPDVAAVIRYFLTISLVNGISQGVHFGSHHQEDGRTSLTQTSHQNGVYISSSQHQLYSSWNQWGPCSTTCGQGISKRSRICNKRQTHSGERNESLCHNEIEHKICKVQDCPPNTTDFRSYQCSQFNNRVIAGHKTKSWAPTNGGSNPCELRCEAVAEKLVYGFGKAADGTFCSEGVCLDGRCLKIGCDDRIGSGAEWDMCGLCAGRNTTCVHYMDVFYGQPNARSSTEGRGEYQEVVVLPVGARNFKLQKTINDNILAVRDRSTALLFHDSVSKLNEEQHVAGTTITYSTESNSTEILTVKGPIVTDLYVMVLLRNKNTGIHYQYWLPLEQTHRHKVHHAQPSYPVSSSTDNHIRLVTDQVYPQTPAQPTKSFSRYTTPQSTYLPTTETFYRTTGSTYQYPVQNLQSSTSSPKRISPASDSPKYGPKRLVVPSNRIVISSPKPATSPKSHAHFTAADTLHVSPRLDKLIPSFRLNYKTRKPVFDYYEKYRNNSYYPQENVYHGKSIYLPQQTQRDSSGLNEQENIAIAKQFDKNLTLKDKKKENREQRNQDKIFSARWEYHFNGNKNVSSGKNFLDTPVSITVLPLPDSANSTKSRKRKLKGSKLPSKSRLTRGGLCEPCQKVQGQTKHFCSSDFVIRASVLSYEFLHGETRYELEVRQSFKNILALLPREYVWSPNTCRCPKLRVGKEYVLMGKIDNNYRRNESRLLVDKNSFVRIFNHKHGRRLHKLKKIHARKCSSKIS